MSKSKLILILVLLIPFLGCRKKGCTDPAASNYDPSAKKDNGSCYYLNLPTDLNVTLDNQVNSGLVNVSATAVNENFFTICFFDGDDSTIVNSVDGSASYYYTDSGSHTIRVRAHLNYDEYTEWIGQVNISLNSSGFSNSGYSTPLSYPNYTLVWNDEFDGNSLSNAWVHEIGNGNWGWGNNELQYYRSQNTEVDDGYLIITAKEENYGGKNYTSSRIKTQGMQSFQYGRIDIRAILPHGQGIWPATWMLGDSYSSTGWPSCGEIDIMELVGGIGYNDRTVHGTIHWDDNGHASYGGSNSLSIGDKFADEFHVFSIVWTPTSIKWLRDDIQYNEADITPASLSEFHQNFFFIFNVAVGGNWPGSPDGTTLFPQRMIVDYVRVFQ